MTEKEKTVRENLFVVNTIAKKLDFVRNDLMALYGRDITLKEVEESLWNQYLKCQDKVHKIFENV